MRIIFLGEVNRADAITWYTGIERFLKVSIVKREIKPSRSRYRRILNAFLFYFNLRYEKHDISLAERATSYGFAGLFVKSKLKVVAQQGITDAYPEKGLSGFYKRVIQKRVYSNSHIIHAWGKIMNPAQLRSGAHPNKIITLSKGLSLDYYPQKSNGPVDFTFIKIIVTRSLNEEYNHKTLIQAIKKLVDNGFININVTIVGDGTLRSVLQKLADTLGLSKYITFLGRVDYDIIPKLLEDHNVYMSVPLTEGFSNSLQEAMAAGLFPIVSDIPGNRALINPSRNGFLVNPYSANDIANKITAISETSWTTQAIEANKKWMNKFGDKEKNMKKFSDLYLNRLEKICVDL